MIGNMLIDLLVLIGAAFVFLVLLVWGLVSVASDRKDVRGEIE